MSLNPFIIDCDTGRDDALAIWSALSLKLHLSGVVASYGNTAVTNVTDNTARVLALGGGAHIPLFAGALQPSQTHVGFENVVVPRQKVSGNGLCNIELPRSPQPLPAPQSADALAGFITSLSKQNGKLDYIILGPATNFASVCDVLGPDIHKHINRVMMMGGKFDALWDQIPGADFNLICDPFAVRKIFEAGFAIQFVPMNVTWPIAMSLEDVENLQTTTALSKTAKDVMIAHLRDFAPEPVFRFHDPSVIHAWVEGKGFEPVTLTISCDEASPDFGRLITQGTYDAAVYRADESVRRKFLNDILASLGLSLQRAAA